MADPPPPRRMIVSMAAIERTAPSNSTAPSARALEPLPLSAGFGRDRTGSDTQPVADHWSARL